MIYYDPHQEYASTDPQMSHFSGAVMEQAVFDSRMTLGLGAVAGHRIGYQVSPTLQFGATLIHGAGSFSPTVGKYTGRMLKGLSNFNVLSHFDSDFQKVLSSGHPTSGKVMETAKLMQSDIARRIPSYQKNTFFNKAAGMFSEESSGRLTLTSTESATFQARNAAAYKYGNRLIRELGGGSAIKGLHEISGGSRVKMIKHSAKYLARGGVAAGVLGGTIGLFLGGPAGAVAGATAGKGLVALGWGLMALDVYKIGKWAVHSTTQSMADAAANYRSLEFGYPQQDTAQSATNRQRAIMEISRSRLNARSALGNEAALLH